MISRIFVRAIALLIFMLPFAVLAQDSNPEMADTMRSNGKIYVVVAVCLTLLIGLFLYMIRVERMVRKLEKEK
jgi:multisubunit Na+/H+ antiporter MnhB subunit